MTLPPHAVEAQRLAEQLRGQGEQPEPLFSVPCVHICGTRRIPVRREPDTRDTRWCFGCRQHLRHEWVLWDDPPEAQPSYYDPSWSLECTRCHRDRTEFPGGDW